MRVCQNLGFWMQSDYFTIVEKLNYIPHISKKGEIGISHRYVDTKTYYAKYQRLIGGLAIFS